MQDACRVRALKRRLGLRHVPKAAEATRFVATAYGLARSRGRIFRPATVAPQAPLSGKAFIAQWRRVRRALRRIVRAGLPRA